MLPDILYLLFSLSLIFSRLIYIVVPISISFLFTVKLYSIIWIYGILLTCSSVGGHLGYLHPVAIVDHAAMNIQVQVLFELLCSTLFSICLELEFLDHMVIPCLTFWGNIKLFSTTPAPFYIPTTNVWGFQLLHILLFYFFTNYGIGCEVVFHSASKVLSLNNYDS